MLDSNNAANQIKNNDPLSFVCPQCAYAFPYTKEALVQCPACYHAGDRSEFKSLRSILDEVN